MLLLPCERIVNRLVSERGGVWIANSLNDPKLWLVAKLQNYLLRDIYAGANIDLNVFVVNIEDNRIVVFGFTVHDDPEHPKVISGACRSMSETEDLAALLSLSSVPIQFYNENGLPLLTAICTFESMQLEDVVSALPTDENLSEDAIDIRQTALDVVESWTHDETKSEPRIMASCKLRVTLHDHELFTAHLPTVGSVNLDNNDQGNELEVLTLHLFDELFSFGAYHSPQRAGAKGMLELCDVLAVSRIRQVVSEGVFVIQNKVALTDGRQRSTERRGLTIHKNIRKGIKQSIGAIKKIKQGVQIYKYDGSRIEQDPAEIVGAVEPLDLTSRAQEVGFGIVLISDMHEGVDWKEVWQDLVAATQETKYYHYVLDLQELHALVTHSNGQPAILEHYLIERWEKMMKEQTAMIRSHFLDKSD